MLPVNDYSNIYLMEILRLDDSTILPPSPAGPLSINNHVLKIFFEGVSVSWTLSNVKGLAFNYFFPAAS